MGAFIGPVLLFLIAAVREKGDLFSTYRLSFAVLGIPALITIGLVLFARRKYPDPEAFEEKQTETAEFRFRKSFALYMVAICLFAFGFADFPLITLHAAKTQAFPDAALSLLYAAAMAVDAFAALFFGWLFDRIGLKALLVSTALSAFFSCFVFLTRAPWLIGVGVVLWGVGMGAQESIMKAAVSRIVPRARRGTGFGIFETGFGAAWFLGSWLLGALYDLDPRLLVAVSATAQLLAIVFYGLCMQRQHKE